jgi:T5SS/PEP-CTERM-associated repeat protein
MTSLKRRSQSGRNGGARRLCCAAIMVLGGASFGHAADWVNAAGGNFSDAINWSGGVVPGAGDTAAFGIAGSYHVLLPSMPTVVGGTAITKGAVGLNVPVGQEFQTYGFAVSGGDARLFGGGNHIIGDPASAFPAGAFTLDNGALNIDGAGTLVEAFNDFDVGTNAGAATFNLSDSAIAELGIIRAATHPQSNVWMTVRDNDNQTLLRGKAAVIGLAGAATLSVVNEGRYNADAVNGLPAITVGGTDGVNRGRGFVLVDGNKSFIRIKGQFDVGAGGDGTLLVSNAGRAAFSGVTKLEVASTVGANGGNGQIRVTGDSSSVRFNGAMIVNRNAGFTPILVENGGLIRAERMEFFDNALVPGTTPVALISGAGTLSAPGKIDLKSGVLRIESDGTVEAGIGLRVGESNGRRARVEFNDGNLRVGELTMSGGDVVLSPGGDKIVRTGRVFFYSPTGQIDLTDNAMMIDYFEFESSPLEGVRSALGSRITSSTAAADPARFALGTAEGFDLPSTGGGVRSFFRESVDNTSVLVRYTYKGDATLDGAVTIADFAHLAAHFNQPGRWFNGDFNNDQTVTIADFASMASNFNLSLPSTSARPGAVPEPTALAVAALASIAVMRRRRN